MRFEMAFATVLVSLMTMMICLQVPAAAMPPSVSVLNQRGVIEGIAVPDGKSEYEF